jgi:hypothetical protein
MDGYRLNFLSSLRASKSSTNHNAFAFGRTFHTEALCKRTKATTLKL